MARYFLDSSAVVKRYHQERGTSVVESLFGAAENQFFVSRLALVEVHSSFARLVREATLAEVDFGRLIARLEEDVATNVFRVVAVSGVRLEGASKILATHGLKSVVRSLDAIHLATAQALHNRTRLAAFVAADRKLLTLAADCGLAVLDVG